MARTKNTHLRSIAGSPPSHFLRRVGRYQEALEAEKAEKAKEAEKLKKLKTSPYFKKERNVVKVKEQSLKQKVKEEEKIKAEENTQLLPKDEGVQDFLDEDLKVMFVGINPGLMSAAKRHHYAGPTNHFWPCLSASGLVDRKVTFEDDQDLPSTYRLGFTNLTARTTRSASELTLAEQRAGIPILNSKFETLRPRIACFIGKGIYEIYSKQKCSKMGLQDESYAVPWLNGKGKTLMFVMPSTSGIVTAYTKADKMRFFQDLNTAVKNLDEL